VDLIYRETPACKGGGESRFLFLPCLLYYNGNIKLYKAAHAVYKTKISYSLDYTLPWEDSGTRCKELPENKPDWNYLEIGIKQDHMHLYMIIPPKYAVSLIVENIKKNISRSLSRKFPFLEKVYWDSKGT